jgi:small-conductance mechanosensitive channel
VWEQLYSHYVETVVPLHGKSLGETLQDIGVDIVVYIVPRLLLAVLLFLLAKLTMRLAHRMFAGFLRSRAVRMDVRRRETMASLLDNITRYVVYFIFVLVLLSSLGVHIEAILAGAGIAGLSVGLAAQGMLKDVISGFSILFEDQFAVGDLVKINNVTGTVESIGLRVTRIKAWTGEVEIIPNGLIGQVTNYSRANSIAVVDVPVTPSTDLDAATAAIYKALEEVRRLSPDVIGEVKVMGVQALRHRDILLRATLECRPATQWAVQRLAHYHIRKALAEAGLEWPEEGFDLQPET